jgi:hypothetical protein
MPNYTTTTTDDGSGAAAIFFGVLILLSIAAYLLPTIIAVARKVPNVGSVAVINILLGWSFVGWVVALSMAARSRAQNPGVLVFNNGQPPTTLNGAPHNAAGQPRSRGAQPPVPRDPGASGWFPDPGGDPALDRFFDGQRWTPTIRPRQPVS